MPCLLPRPGQNTGTPLLQPPAFLLQRGGGPDQPIMRTVAGEVARGRWVHIFPEGRVHYTGQLGPLRWGVGKLVCDAAGHAGRCVGGPAGADGHIWGGTGCIAL